MQHTYKLCPMLCALSAVMHPFVLLCNLISDGLMRLLGNDPKRLMKPSPKKKSSTWSAKARKKALSKKMSAT